MIALFIRIGVLSSRIDELQVHLHAEADASADQIRMLQNRLDDMTAAPPEVFTPAAPVEPEPVEEFVRAE